MPRTKFQPGPADDHYHNTLGVEEEPAEVTIYQASVTLTDAQIKALPSTAVDLVPAQGAGTVIDPLRIVLSSSIAQPYDAPLSTGYLLVGPRLTDGESDLGDIGLHFHEGTDLGNDLVSDLLTGDALVFGGPAIGIDSTLLILQPYLSFDRDDFDNRPLALRAQAATVAAADFTAGDPANTLKVTVWYGIFEV